MIEFEKSNHAILKMNDTDNRDLWRMVMNLSIREWRIGDKTALAKNLNNPKVLNNLRDG